MKLSERLEQNLQKLHALVEKEKRHPVKGRAAIQYRSYGCYDEVVNLDGYMESKTPDERFSLIESMIAEIGRTCDVMDNRIEGVELSCKALAAIMQHHLEDLTDEEKEILQKIRRCTDGIICTDVKLTEFCDKA